MIDDEFPISDTELRRRTESEEAPFGATRAEVLALFQWSRRQAARRRDELAALSAYVLFVGYPRSGHSLVGALLDAHDEMAIAHELHVMLFLGAGFSRDQVLLLTAENSRRLANAGRRWGRYDYAVEGGAQGRWTTLKVAGDKRGAGITKILLEEPDAIDRLAQFLKLPIRVLHVVRDPRANVPSMAAHYRAADPVERLDMALGHYRTLAQTNARALVRLGRERSMTVWHEDLVVDPRGGLAAICRFLGVAPTASYLEACARIVSPERRQPRPEPPWTPSQRQRLARLIEEVPFLRRYADQAELRR